MLNNSHIKKRSNKAREGGRKKENGKKKGERCNMSTETYKVKKKALFSTETITNKIVESSQWKVDIHTLYI